MGRKSNLLLIGGGGADVAADGWTPDDLTDSIWFDFSDTSNMWSDGARATAIADNTGLQEIQAKGSFSSLPAFTQSTSANRPTWQDTGYADFDGTNDCLLLASELFGAGNELYGYNQWSMFFLGTFNPAGASDDIFAERVDNTDGDFTLIRSNGATTSSPVLLTRHAGGGIPNNSQTIASNVLDNTLNMWGIVVDNASDDFEGFIDDTGQGATTFTIPYANTQSIDNCTIGANTYNGSQGDHHRFQLRQLVATPNALSGSDITSLKTFFQSKGLA